MEQAAPPTQCEAPFVTGAAPFCGVATVGCGEDCGAAGAAFAVVVVFGVLAARGVACTVIAGAAGAVGTLIVPLIPFFCFFPIVWRAARVAWLRARACALVSTLRTGAFGGGKPKSCASLLVAPN